MKFANNRFVSVLSLGAFLFRSGGVCFNLVVYSPSLHLHPRLQLANLFFLILERRYDINDDDDGRVHDDCVSMDNPQPLLH